MIWPRSDGCRARLIILIFYSCFYLQFHIVLLSIVGPVITCHCQNRLMSFHLYTLLHGRQRSPCPTTEKLFVYFVGRRTLCLAWLAILASPINSCGVRSTVAQAIHSPERANISMVDACLLSRAIHISLTLYFEKKTTSHIYILAIWRVQNRQVSSQFL